MLPSLPPELLLLTVSYLETEGDVNSLCRTSRALYRLFNLYLYQMNVRNSGSSALNWAALHGHESTARASIRAGADLRAQDSVKKTPLARAVMEGHTKMVKLLLESVLESTNEADDNDVLRALFWAAENEHDEIVLSDAWGVNPNGRSLSRISAEGRTLLSHAAEEGHAKMVNLLLKSGQVEVNARDPTPSTEGLTPLCHAVLSGNLSVVAELLAHKDVDVNRSDASGATPLLWAAANGEITMVKLLLERKEVKVDVEDMNELTPLSWAASSGHADIVDLLLATGQVEVDKMDVDGLTPLSRAAANGHRAVVEVLLETGQAQINAEDFDGLTPL